MKAYILAAGYGTRMYPLTRDLPKTFLEVGGATILDHIVGRLRAIDDLTHITVVTNTRFVDRFDAWRAMQPVFPPVTVLNDGTTSDEHRLGAVADLRLALRHVPLEGEDAIVVASDNLFDFDLAAVARTFRADGRPLLLVRQSPDQPEPSPYNEVTMDPDGRVTRFREKPPRAETDLTAIALYFFPAEVLASLGEYLHAGNPDAPGHFLAWIVDRFPVVGVPIPGRWFDIGSIESLESARREWGRQGR